MTLYDARRRERKAKHGPTRGPLYGLTLTDLVLLAKQERLDQVEAQLLHAQAVVRRVEDLLSHRIEKGTLALARRQLRALLPLEPAPGRLGGPTS